MNKANKARPNKGTFPVSFGNAEEKRFKPRKSTKAHSSHVANKGDFPVKMSEGAEKRFNPRKS